MNSLSIIVGVGVLCAILLYIANSVDSKKHQVLRFLIIMFAFSITLLIPVATMDDQTICETVTNTSTYDVATDTTSYTWTHHCFDRSDSSPDIFYKTVLWTYRLFWAYIIVFLGWLSLKALQDSIRGRKRG